MCVCFIYVLDLFYMCFAYVWHIVVQYVGSQSVPCLFLFWFAWCFVCFWESILEFHVEPLEWWLKSTIFVHIVQIDDFPFLDTTNWFQRRQTDSLKYVLLQIVRLMTENVQGTIYHDLPRHGPRCVCPEIWFTQIEMMMKMMIYKWNWGYLIFIPPIQWWICSDIVVTTFTSNLNLSLWFGWLKLLFMLFIPHQETYIFVPCALLNRKLALC